MHDERSTTPLRGRRRPPTVAVSRATIRARRAGLLGGVVVVVVLILLVTGGGGGPPRLLAGGGGAGGTFDPLAYRAADETIFEAAAAAGQSHLIFAKSPGGVTASAKRTESFAGLAAKAAAGGPLGARTLAAIVMLESAGRPDVIAGTDPSAAAGLTQIVAATATQLLGMRVDLPASRRLGSELATATARGETALVGRLQAARARVDQRFDPAAALVATEQYLKTAKGIFGRDDLAVESYHMGIGNLETALRRYVGGAQASDPIARLVAEHGLSYAKLYFDSTPIDHASAYTWLAGLGDDSATYLWRIAAAANALALYRSDPSGLAAQAKLENAAGSDEFVLRGPGTPVLATRADVAAAQRSGALTAVPTGATATALGLRVDRPLSLAPDALATALYMAAAVRAIGGAGALLDLTAGVSATADLGATARASHGLAEADPLDASGYAFDVARTYASPAQAQAFQFVLDRLSALDLIAWNREGRIIHVVVGPRATTLRGLLARLLGGRSQP